MIATIGIGLPGVGKTTRLKKLAAESGAVYICPDDIRVELTGNADDQSRNSEVWDVAYQRMDAELAAGRDIVVDATSARRGDRMKLVARCRQGADRIVGVWFTAPYRVCLHRNQQRERVVPEFSMGLMAGWLEAYPPSEAEGFDEVVKVNTCER
ncbi:MAG TPA: ATP-binding protein [Candidatus Saccharimonadales bacterium]